MEALRFLRSAAILAVGAAGVVALIIALALVANFLIGAAAAYLCLLLLVGLVAFIVSACKISSRADVEIELACPVVIELGRRR
jgi:hypothetical protein